MTDYSDLLRRLQRTPNDWQNPEQELLNRAATAIEFQQGMIEQADRQIAEYRQRAEAAEAVNAALTARLVRIYSFLGPEDVRLPDGRVMRFNNPTIEREMLRELSAAIRAIPDAMLEEKKE